MLGQVWFMKAIARIGTVLITLYNKGIPISGPS